jgi:hypothetical protein
MTRAEKKAMQARVAVRVLAQMTAKNAVKNQIRAQGLKIWDFTSKEITLRAEAMLKEHPEMIAEARAKAASLGYAVPTI